MRLVGCWSASAGHVILVVDINRARSDQKEQESQEMAKGDQAEKGATSGREMAKNGPKIGRSWLVFGQR